MALTICVKVAHLSHHKQSIVPRDYLSTNQKAACQLFCPVPNSGLIPRKEVKPSSVRLYQNIFLTTWLQRRACRNTPLWIQLSRTCRRNLTVYWVYWSIPVYTPGYGVYHGRRFLTLLDKIYIITINIIIPKKCYKLWKQKVQGSYKLRILKKL